MKPKLLFCLALLLSGGLVHGGETAADSTTNSFLRAILSRLSDKAPEWSVENLSQGAPYTTNTVSAFYTNSDGIRLDIIAKAYGSEVAAKNGQESDARGISVNADKMEIINSVKIYEYTRYGGLYFQKGCYTFRFETFHGGNEDVQRFLLKVCAALISEFDSDVSAPKQDAGAEEHFKDYLAKCDTNEVRCLWFLQDKPEVGMVMTVNLDKESVFTATEVYSWAEKGSEIRQLSDAQKLNLEKTICNLPASDRNAGFDKSVFVSLRNGSQVKIFQYDRQNAPAIIQRIYDLGGGYFEDDKP